MGAAEAQRPDGSASPLSQLSYKDFERVYPAPPEAKKLEARYSAILTRVTEVFRPVGASAVRPASSGERRPRPGSGNQTATSGSRSNAEAGKTSGGTNPLPPKPPVLRANAPTVPPSGVASRAPLVGRSRSAPVQKSHSRSPDLPAIPSSRSPSPAGSPHAQRRPTSREAAPRARASSQRASLPMKSIQIAF